MRAPSRLPAMRARAESLMNATFDVFAPGGSTVVHGFKVDGYARKTPVCGKVQGGSTSSADAVTRYVTVGGVQRSVLAGGLHIPISAEVPTAGDHGIGWEYQCTFATCPEDASLVGRRFLVVGSPAKSYATARRLDVVEIPVPEVP